MRANYTYVLSIIDEATEEPSLVLVHSQHELLLVVSRLQETQTLISVQNLGITTEGDDFLKKLDEEGGLNFGNNGGAQ